MNKSVAEELAIVLREADLIAQGKDTATALATLRQAAHMLMLMLDPNQRACARLNRFNGDLSADYNEALARVLQPPMF